MLIEKRLQIFIHGSVIKMIHKNFINIKKYITTGTSLVAQWLRICLPTQGTWVRSLVWEDPTCRRATKPVRHNY